METTWLSDEERFDKLILAADCGGTNTSIALFGNTGRAFSMLLKCVFKSKQIRDFLDPVAETLSEARRKNPALKPVLCCASGAGPVKDNVCALTNASWSIDGPAIEKRFGLRAAVVNDFTALSFGMPILDIENPLQITKIPHPDGAFPVPNGERTAVVGAGTGLGTGFLIEAKERFVAVPTEAGHSDFAPADEEMVELWRFVGEQYPHAPGTEAFVSGRGISNIFQFYKERGAPMTGALAEIDALPDDAKPARIAAHVQDSPECERIMKLFVRMYGHYASRVSLMFIPTRGLFLAGGIVAKNESLFLGDHLFMKAFETNYKENIRGVLKSIPVFIVRDYATSLYGAANAARSLLG